MPWPIGLDPPYMLPSTIALPIASVEAVSALDPIAALRLHNPQGLETAPQATELPGNPVVTDQAPGRGGAGRHGRPAPDAVEEPEVGPTMIAQVDSLELRDLAFENPFERLVEHQLRITLMPPPVTTALQADARA